MRNIFVLLFSLVFNFLAVAQTKVQRPFEMEWDPVEEASQYEVEILSKGKTLIKKVSSKPRWSGAIKPGTYSYRIRAYDRRKVPGPWSELEPLTVYLSPSQNLFPSKGAAPILTKSSDEYEIEFKWKPVNLADGYKIFVKGLNSDESKELTVTEVTSVKTKLKVGKRYEWWVLPTDSKKEYFASVEEAEKSEFELVGGPLRKAEMKIPDTLYIREFSWSSDENAKRYTVKVFRKKSEKSWELMKLSEHSDPFYFVPLNWPGGRYQVQIVSQAELYEDSQMAVASFELAEGDRSEEAQFKAELRASIEGFKGWYGQASYLITQIDYWSRQRFLGTTVNTRFSNLFGTVRLGLGNLGSQKDWGFLSNLDISGMFNQQGENVIFSGIESVALYRTQLTYRDEIRLKFGGYFKELPFALIDISGPRVDQYHNISSYGLVTGGEYWFSISPKFGFQAHAYFYSSAMATAPVLSRNVQGYSQQIGVLGSYKMSKVSAGLMGLAFRQDEASFQTLDSSGSNMGQSGVNVRGIFLNFILEQSF
jgi:hypothetical protein